MDIGHQATIVFYFDHTKHFLNNKKKIDEFLLKMPGFMYFLSIPSVQTRSLYEVVIQKNSPRPVCQKYLEKFGATNCDIFI